MNLKREGRVHNKKKRYEYMIVPKHYNQQNLLRMLVGQKKSQGNIVGKVPKKTRMMGLIIIYPRTMLVMKHLYIIKHISIRKKVGLRACLNWE